MLENELDVTEIFMLTNSKDDPDRHYELEFAYLCICAGFYPCHTFFQNIQEVNNSTYCGKGKLEEIRDYYQENKLNSDETEEIKILACNFDLTALQQRNIEKMTGLRVIDRTSIILRIFEMNAKTREAKLQVEIAKLEYFKSHLMNNTASYSQVTSGGGAHNKGQGEKQIELDRRKIRDMILYRKSELEEIRLSRRNMRNRRVNSPVPKVAIVGYTNAGKSTLVNAILGEKRVITSEKENTTRDAIDTPFVRDGKNYVVIDTAGLKKRGKIYESVDKYSAIRALKAIERSEIVLLVLDGEQGILDQDKHVIQYATDLHKAIVIVVNKWDAVDKETNTMSEFTKKIRNEYKFLDYAPVVFCSALRRTRINTVFEALEMAHNAYYTRIKTSILNDVLQDAQVMNISPDFNGGRVKIYYGSQVSVAPPHIALFVNNPEWMHFSYLRYIENRLRETFNFEGTPIKLSLRAKKK